MFVVTGVSKGLGKAIVEALLAEGEKVLGIGRTHNFSHPNFSFLHCDLGNSNELHSLEIKIETDTITLINNAGILGEVVRLSDQECADVEKVLWVNTIAPILIMNKIYKQIQNKNNFTLVNISSGAANRPIPSWAAYCASKSALNMLTETFALEEKEKGNNPKVYAVAPGVIDTAMQEKIRNTSLENFSSVQNFIDLKENSELYSAEYAATRLLELLNKPYSGEVLCDLRSI